MISSSYRWGNRCSEKFWSDTCFGSCASSSLIGAFFKNNSFWYLAQVGTSGLIWVRSPEASLFPWFLLIIFLLFRQGNQDLEKLSNLPTSRQLHSDIVKIQILVCLQGSILVLGPHWCHCLEDRTISTWVREFAKPTKLISCEFPTFDYNS